MIILDFFMGDDEDYKQLRKDESEIFAKLKQVITPEEKKILFDELGTISRMKTKILDRSQ